MPLLFSYGTLQDDAVQLRTFERLLTGEPDELRGQDPQERFTSCNQDRLVRADPPTPR